MNLRPNLAQHLRQRLEAFGEGFRQNLALLGPSGSGKTFQLQELLHDRPPGVLFIYCPLYRESSRSFLQRFLCAILQAGLDTEAPPAHPSPLGSELVSQPLASWLQRAESSLPNTVAAIRLIEPLVSKRLYGEAFSRSLDTIPTLQGERQRPCVLIFDEFLCLEDLGLVHAFHELGKRVMTWQSTVFILSSSSVFRARMILRERLQLLFGQFELVTLEALDPSVVTMWVQQELRGIRGAKTLSPFLIRWLGAYPWYLTVFLKRFKELAALSKHPGLIEPLFLQTSWDLMGSREGSLHHWCASRLEGLAHSRLGARAMEALGQIAEGVRTTTELGTRIGRARVSDALQVLVEHDLVQRNGMCWLVIDPVLRLWLSTVLMAQRTDARVEPQEVRQRFEHRLRSLWLQWTHTQQRSLSERVAELFTKFADDTVSLDSKTGRLPKFETILAHHPGNETEAYLIADGPGGKRWCATVQAEAMEEQHIARFEAFCRGQAPRPARKVVIVPSSLDPNAKLLAKASNMWVWESRELQTLMELYGEL